MKRQRDTKLEVRVLGAKDGEEAMKRFVEEMAALAVELIQEGVLSDEDLELEELRGRTS